MNLDGFIITCFCLVDEMLPSVTAGRDCEHEDLCLSCRIVRSLRWKSLACTWEKAKARNSLSTFVSIRVTSFQPHANASHHLCATGCQLVGHQGTLEVYHS